MLLLAHTGITLGIFNLCQRIFFRISSYRKKGGELVPPIKSYGLSSVNPDPPVNPKKWGIDYRLILLGSMFPDIVDKPLGMLIFADLVANGRVYTHTLLVNLVLVLIGVYLLKKKRFGFLIFSLSSCFHLILDEMWLTPQTLFWPLYWWGFPREDISHWWENIFYGLFANPWVYVPEIIGGVILISFGLTLIKRKVVGEFLLKGTVE